MNNDLIIVLKTLVNHRVLLGDISVTTDVFCAEFNYSEAKCTGVQCNECIFGHKNTQYYPKDIIKIWGTTWIKT